jgi:hypothetical protein
MPGEIIDITPENLASRNPQEFFHRQIDHKDSDTHLTVSALTVTPVQEGKPESYVISTSGRKGNVDFMPERIEISQLPKELVNDVADITATALSVVPFPTDNLKFIYADVIGKEPAPDEKRLLPEMLYDEFKRRTGPEYWEHYKGDRLQPVFKNWDEFKKSGRIIPGSPMSPLSTLVNQVKISK